jgi:ABC-type lipoprotein release transport system permease subunit
VAKDRGDLLQGTLDMLVLNALQLEPMHGRGITERIEQWSWTFAVTALVLLVVATVASYVSARRGMRMAPVDALRTN